MALGLGWIGLLFGLQLDREQLAEFPASYLLFTALQAVLTFVLVAAVAYLALRTTGQSGPGVSQAMLVAAATAAVSTPAGIALINGAFPFRGQLTRLLFFVASLDAVIGIIALQLTYSLFPPSTAGAVAAFGWGIWLAIATAAGIIFGVLFLWLTRPKPQRDELALFLLGLAVFEAGTALYLGVSPLYVAAITGAVIANMSPLRRRVYGILQDWEKPVYIVLLILAGAFLGASSTVAFGLAAAYLAVRIGAKVVAGSMARALVRLPVPTPPGVGAGLVPQGGISLAMALSAGLTYGMMAGADGGPIRVAFGTIVGGVAASELVGPFFTRRLLRRAGELGGRNRPAP
jgi:hypothetical protein